MVKVVCGGRGLIESAAPRRRIAIVSGYGLQFLQIFRRGLKICVLIF